MPRGETQIYQPSQASDGGKQIVASAASKFKTDGIVGIVGQRKAFNSQVAELEGRPGIENSPFRVVFQLRLNGSSGHQVGIDHGIEFLSEG